MKRKGCVMKKTMFAIGLLGLLFILDRSFFLKEKNIWLDVTVHSFGGMFAALLAGSFLDWCSQDFREGYPFFRIVVVISIAVTLGVILELSEAVKMFSNDLVPLDDPGKLKYLYADNIRDLTSDVFGTVLGALLYAALTDLKGE